MREDSASDGDSTADDGAYAEARYVARFLAWIEGELHTLPPCPLRDMHADMAASLAEHYGMPPLDTPPDDDLLDVVVTEVHGRLTEVGSVPWGDHTEEQTAGIMAGLPFTWTALQVHTDRIVGLWLPNGLDGSSMATVKGLYRGGIIVGALAQQFRR